jgi:hypothetical protein
MIEVTEQRNSQSPWLIQEPQKNYFFVQSGHEKVDVVYLRGFYLSVGRGLARVRPEEVPWLTKISSLAFARTVKSVQTTQILSSWRKVRDLFNNIISD